MKGTGKKKERPMGLKNLGRERAGSFTGCIEELWKKKRKREEERAEEKGKEENIFKNSGKTVRSPEKEKGEVIEGLLRDLREEMKEAREERKEMRRVLEEMDRRWGRERKEMKREIEGIGKRMDRMEVEKGKMEEKVKVLEKGGEKTYRGGRSRS